jgi:hypothetical protein
VALPGQSFPAVDLTDFDLAPAARAASRLGTSLGRRAVGLAKDVTYVSVGLGILTYQRAQVRRREMMGARDRSPRS